MADGRGDEVREGIPIHDVGAASGRLGRMLNTTHRMYHYALELGGQIHHLHDPELIPMGLKLKRKGKIVVFDAHEDLPKQILAKPYLSRPMSWFVSNVCAAYERMVCGRFDAVVAATPCIGGKFLAINSSTVTVSNYPLLDEFAANTRDWNAKRKQVCYIGGLEDIRGIKEMVRAFEHVRCGARLRLGGSFSEQQLAHEVMAYSGWQNVDYCGWLDRDQVRHTLHMSVAGLVTLHPLVNYMEASPVKMFEYMSAGIPVIASRFPLWREIVEGNSCGLCVDPLDPEAIAGAIDYLVENPERAQEIGRNGRRAVQERYNWSLEERKLLSLYRRLIEKTR